MEEEKISTKETDENSVRYCKKCGEPLASDSPFDECDSCRRAWAEKGKKALKVLGAVGAALVGVAWFAIQSALGKKDE